MVVEGQIFHKTSNVGFLKNKKEKVLNEFYFSDSRTAINERIKKNTLIFDK